MQRINFLPRRQAGAEPSPDLAFVEDITPEAHKLRRTFARLASCGGYRSRTDDLLRARQAL